MQKDNDTNSGGADQQYLQELSALLDGECRSSQLVMNDAAANEACRASWQSYHLIRDVMQKECPSALPANFASLVSEQIAHEDNIADHTASDQQSAAVIPFADAGSAPRQSRQKKTKRRSASRAVGTPRWLPFAGLGLAASVAAAGVVAWQVVQNYQGPATAQSITVAQADTSTNQLAIDPDSAASPGIESGLVRAVFRGDTGTRWVAASGQHDAKVEQRLNSLLLNHMEDSSMSRVQGMVAHTRLVGYDSESIDDSF